MTVYVVESDRVNRERKESSPVFVTFKTLAEAKLELGWYNRMYAYHDLGYRIYKLTIKKERVK